MYRWFISNGRLSRRHWLRHRYPAGRHHHLSVLWDLCKRAKWSRQHGGSALLEKPISSHPLPTFIRITYFTFILHLREAPASPALHFSGWPRNLRSNWTLRGGGAAQLFAPALNPLTQHEDRHFSCISSDCQTDSKLKFPKMNIKAFFFCMRWDPAGVWSFFRTDDRALQYAGILDTDDGGQLPAVCWNVLNVLLGVILVHTFLFSALSYFFSNLPIVRMCGTEAKLWVKYCLFFLICVPVL